jgi:ribosomal protein RSM22 (predicted rRNA methylase)
LRSLGRPAMLPPIAPLPHVEPVSAALLTAIDAVARERFGAGDLRGAALARAVQNVSAAYTQERSELPSLRGDRAALCARLRFFLPRDAPKIAAPLAELAAASALPQARTLRVLDLGAGLGTTSLGAARLLLAQPGVERVVVDAVDRDGDALVIASALAKHYAREAGLALELETRNAALTPALLDRLTPPYHLILLGFVLNELALEHDEPVAQHVTLLRRASALLAPGGAIIVLEPALRAQARALQLTRGEILAQGGPPYVFAPCLHAGACPLLARERDWCHERLPQALPEPIATIARDAGLRDAELSYAYLSLHQAPRSLAELEHGARERLYRVVSAPLASKGKLELLLCGASGATRARRLDRAASASNDALTQCNRGSIARIDHGVQNGETLKIASETAIVRLP